MSSEPINPVESSNGALIHAAPIRTVSINVEQIGVERMNVEQISTKPIAASNITTEKISAMPIVTLPTIPSTMRAAVYRGINDVRVETVPVPVNADGTIDPGEVLVRIDT